MFSLFISEMKFSFDGIKISVRNLYTEKLYGKGMQEGISETPFRKINIRRYNMNGSLKQFTFSLTYLPTHLYIYTYIYNSVFVYATARNYAKVFHGSVHAAKYTRTNLRRPVS